MNNAKMNCWEVMNCGREASGRNVEELGECPASSYKIYHGINSGINSGRICWSVAGTYCKGKVQGTFAAKERNCSQCNFFKTVSNEEEIMFQLLPIDGFHAQNTD